MVLTSLLGADAADELGAVLERFLAVEGGLSTGEQRVRTCAEPVGLTRVLESGRSGRPRLTVLPLTEGRRTSESVECMKSEAEMGELT